MCRVFATDQERSAWIQAHADYWTVIRFRDRKYERLEFPSMVEAIEEAKRMVGTDPTARLLIYAISGVLSCYVTTIKKES